MNVFKQCMAVLVAAIGAGGAGAAGAQGSFVPTAAMTTPRAHQGSVVLADGRVFQYGGISAMGDILASAELYDPATGTYAATGDAADARMRPTTVGLADGRVLVTGGRGGHEGSVIFDTVELYDPATGTFGPGGSVATRRYVGIVARLPDGKVLLTGGFNFTDGTLGSSEIYDPATQTAAPTGSLVHPRDTYGHALTLADGRIMIVGGYDDDGPLATVEIYDPAAGTFALTGDMPDARGDHCALVLADGRVLVLGGFGSDWQYAMDAYLWDPATGQFRTAGRMTYPRANAHATLLADGRVLVAGGSTTGGSDLYEPRAELWDPATETFSEAGAMITARSGGRAERLDDGRVLYMGGWFGDGQNPTGDSELFVPAVETIFADGFED
ncbi:MAG: galactose oxidase [Rhodanobacter denitrificans]|uniref:Galactose oxidase n=1 Tax=Rhodanobacter denitrificans TaxID=666685 RepID=A0A2W5MII6_9GAMM|nr:MAG: galactose oxidase [Rhodanobacter denitrificans]